MTAGQANSGDGSTPEPMATLFAALSGGDGQGVDRALVALLERMKLWASRELRNRGIKGGADLQIDSLVGSAAGADLKRLIEQARDAEHFEALLRLRLKHKLIDRLKRGGRNGRVRAFGDLADNTTTGFNPAAPRSEEDLDAYDDRRKLDRLKKVLTAPGSLSAEQWQLIEAHLLRERSLGEIAEELGIDRDAAKHRYATVRRRAMKAVFADIEPRLSSPAREVARQALIDRDDVSAVAANTAMSDAEVLFLSLDNVIPALFDSYGGVGARIVGGLLARSG